MGRRNGEPAATQILSRNVTSENTMIPWCLPTFFEGVILARERRHITVRRCPCAMIRLVLQGCEKGATAVGITIPRVTLSADYGKGKSFGELSLLSIGFGLHQAWVYGTMFSPQAFFATNASPLAGIVGGEGASVMLLASIFVYGIALIFSAITDQRFIAVYTSRRFLIVGAILATLGTFAAMLPAEWLAAEVVAGVLTGIGSCILILAWGITFARCDELSIVINAAVAVFVAMLVYSVAVHNIAAPWGSVLIALIPLAELAILWKKTPRPYFERGDVPLFKPLPVSLGRFVPMFGIPVAVFGFALGVLRQVSLRDMVPSMQSDAEFFMLLAAGVAAVVVLTTAIGLGSGGNWTNLFRILVPVLAAAALFWPAAQPGEMSLGGFLFIAAYMCFESLLWIYFGELSQQFRLSPILVFGIGRGVVALSMLLGLLMPTFLDASSVSALGEAGVMWAVLALVAVGYALLPSEADMRKRILPCPVVNMALSGVALDAAAVPAAFSEAKSPKGHFGIEHAAVFQDLDDFPAGRSGSDVDGGAPGHQGNESGSAASSDGGGARNDAAGPALGKKSGWFKANCEIIANRYLLSRRETEVLFLLAKGHNSGAIQEKLYIAEGTAKTHIRHIYRKLDVHNQQELMKMVETADEYDS